MIDRYFIFRKQMDFLTDFCEVTDADMKNYSGDIEIHGIDDDGSTIRITVQITEAKKEDETHGN